MATTITSLPTTLMSALPTPPFTPVALMPQDAHLLGSLIAHYQRERMWVKNTHDMISVARQLQRLPSSDSAGGTTAGKRAGIPLWQRRKSQRSLHLSDIAQIKLSKRLLEHDAYSIKLLDLFAVLLDARIESCTRMEKLVIQSADPRRRFRR